MLHLGMEHIRKIMEIMDDDDEELYFYISKQPFNKTNQDIEFYPFKQIIA